MNSGSGRKTLAVAIPTGSLTDHVVIGGTLESIVTVTLDFFVHCRSVTIVVVDGYRERRSIAKV